MPRTCPYCQSETARGAAVVRCAKCDTPYHADCWRENGGCAVYGCASKACIPPLPPTPPRSGPRPPVAQSAGELRCPNCYARIQPHDDRCISCGRDLLALQELPAAPARPAVPTARASGSLRGVRRALRLLALAVVAVAFFMSWEVDVKLGFNKAEVIGWVALDESTDSNGNTDYHAAVNRIGLTGGPTYLSVSRPVGERLRAAMDARGTDPFAAQFPGMPFGRMPLPALPGMPGGLMPAPIPSPLDRQLLCRLHYAGLGRQVVYAFDEYRPQDEQRLTNEAFQRMMYPH